MLSFTVVPNLAVANPANKGQTLNPQPLPPGLYADGSGHFRA